VAKRFEDTQVLIMDEQDEDKICAWHEREKDPEGSHGICIPCKEQLYLNYQITKFNRVPSYVERFRRR
jgi:hypothetical protein